MQEKKGFNSLRCNTRGSEEQIQINTLLNKTKRNRIKINNLDEFKDALKKEVYEINDFNGERFKEELINIFKVDRILIENLYSDFNNPEIIYKVYDIMDLIDYIKKIMLFENEHNKLCRKISKMSKITVYRVEYERKPSVQDDVEYILRIIEKLKKNISGIIDKSYK